MISIQKILLILLSTSLMIGCAKNDISIYNLGSKEWNNINVSAGGRSFNIEKLDEGASHTFAFIGSRREGGGSAQIWMAKFMSENLDISHRTLRIIMKLCLRMMVQYGSMKESIIKIHTTKVSA